MTESDIKMALAWKHGKDFYIDNVKNGPTRDATGLRILDFWAMKKSWAYPLTICYEIKISCSDFNSDTKWPAYLDCADKFYFAVPKELVTTDDIIKKAELANINPDYVGLIYIRSLKSCRIIKDCVDRNIEIPEDFYRYVLMNKIYPDRIPFYNEKKDFLAAWLDNKRSDKDIGWRIRTAFASKIAKQSRELDRLKSIINSIESKTGIELNCWSDVNKLIEHFQQEQLL